MLTDRTNTLETTAMRSASSHETSTENNKQVEKVNWTESRAGTSAHATSDDANQNDWLPSKLREKRQRIAYAASSSSPSSARQSSSFSSPFGNTKFLPYDRPSSPLLQFPASDDAHRLATTKDTFFATASDDIDETKFSLSSPLDAAPPQLPVATAPVVVLPTIPERTIIGTDGERLNLRLGLGQRVRFGRKVKTKSIASRSQTDGKDAQDDDATTRELITIRLPKSAKYASRLHCTLHAVPLLSSTPSSPSSTGSSRLSTRNGDTVQNCTLIVKVLGQNGMKIDGVVFATGTEKRISSVGASATKVELDFWGWGMSIILGGGSPVSKSNLRQLQQSVVGAKDEAMSSEDDSDEEDIDRGIIARRVSSKGATASTSIPKQQRDDSPALSVLSSLSSSSPIVESVPLPSARNINANKRRRPSVSSLSSSSSSSHHDDNDDETASATHSRALALVESLSLDLQGLIASAIVFHHRSTVGVEEVIRALLKDVGGMWAILKNDESRFKSSRRDVFMSSVDGGSDDEDRREKKEEEAVDAWWDCIEDVLSGNKMFGCIGNVGLTDATGNAVPPAYYYQPEHDNSTERVEALEPFVKRVRGARVAGGGKQYFWRRPALKKRW